MEKVAKTSCARGTDFLPGLGRTRPGLLRGGIFLLSRVSYCLDVSHSSLSSSFRPSEPLRQNFEWVDLEPHTTPAAPLRSLFPKVSIVCNTQNKPTAQAPSIEGPGLLPLTFHIQASLGAFVPPLLPVVSEPPGTPPSYLPSLGSTWPRGPHGYFYCHWRFSHCLGLPLAAYHFPPQPLKTPLFKGGPTPPLSSPRCLPRSTSRHVTADCPFLEE